jgi:hypothetical protein
MQISVRLFSAGAGEQQKKIPAAAAAGYFH